MKMLDCGSELQHGSQFVGNDNGIENGNFRPNPDSAYCNMGCQGNASETCGGPALLNVYNFTGTYPVGASVVPSVTLGTWTSQGCYRYGTPLRAVTHDARNANRVPTATRYLLARLRGVSTYRT